VGFVASPLSGRTSFFPLGFLFERSTGEQFVGVWRRRRRASACAAACGFGDPMSDGWDLLTVSPAAASWSAGEISGGVVSRPNRLRGLLLFYLLHMCFQRWLKWCRQLVTSLTSAPSRSRYLKFLLVSICVHKFYMSSIRSDNVRHCHILV
jgi:hypothetical protein